MVAVRQHLRMKVLALILTPLLAALAMAVEVALAINAPRLPNKAPYELNRSGSPSARRILWLGDSTAAGVGATSAGNTLPMLVAAANETEGDATIVARSISGATVADVLHDQLDRLEGERFDRIYISIGANDVTGLTSRKAFERTYVAMLGAVPEATEVVLLGIPDMGSPPRLPQPLRTITGWRGEQLDDVIQNVARSRNLRYVDIAGQTGPAFRAHPVKYFAADDYHPNDAGYELWRDAVVTAAP